MVTQLSQYGYEHVGGNKYATVVSGYTTWFGAYAACQKKNHKEVVQVSGYDDNTKKYAWAVPDSLPD
ncbi:hypothetical protein Avbf_05352 [Armadillidium vulgare]|nr:hypothetical protein Avbf_05352 [Armadillidium vulgare]